MVDQPGMVANPARGQLNRKNEHFPVRVRSRLRIWSRIKYHSRSWSQSGTKVNGSQELGRNPVSNHYIQPEYGDDEQADAGRDCRTGLARLNSQARTRTGKYSFSRFS